MKILQGLVLLSIVAGCASAQADLPRQRVKLADLPEPVRRTATQQKGHADIVRLERIREEGRFVFELELGTGLARKIVLIDAGGKVLEIQQHVKLQEISPAARSVIESSVGNGKIVGLDSVKTASGIIAAYEVQFIKEGKHTELRVAPDGSLAQK